MNREKMRCWNCRYWEGPEGEGTDRLGSCRYDPPVLLATIDGRTAQTAPAGAWPVTSGMDWCGKFRSTQKASTRNESDLQEEEYAGRVEAPAPRREQREPRVAQAKPGPPRPKSQEIDSRPSRPAHRRNPR